MGPIPMIGNFSISVTDEIEILNDLNSYEWVINADYPYTQQLEEFLNSLQAKTWTPKELDSFIKLHQIEWKLDGTKISITKKRKKGR
jgi:hypothetical protein